MEFKHYLIIGIICVAIGAGVPALSEMLDESEQMGAKKSSIGMNRTQMLKIMQGGGGGGGGMGGGMDINQMKKLLR